MGERTVILLVEDSDSDALLIEQAFRKSRVLNEIRRVSTGLEAVHYINGHHGYGDRIHFPFPAMILLDLMLPDMSGYELLRWIQNDPIARTTPVAIVTGSRNPGDAAATRSLGACAFFEKNLHFENLIELVRSSGASWALTTRA
jgi:CheY-like chemotaxis protein